VKKYIFFAFLILCPSCVLATPIIKDISSAYTSNSLVFTAIYESPDNSFDPWTIGGWCFQIFIDTDQDDSTGLYSGGFEFNVRAVELEANGFIHVRRTEGGGGPGGWGESMGTVPLTLGDSFFSTIIPLSFLDYDDGSLDYRLDIYDTIEGDWQGTGITHAGGTFYVGSSSPIPEPATIALLGIGLIGLAMASRKKAIR